MIGRPHISFGIIHNRTRQGNYEAKRRSDELAKKRQNNDVYDDEDGNVVPHKVKSWTEMAKEAKAEHKRIEEQRRKSRQYRLEELAKRKAYEEAIWGAKWDQNSDDDKYRLLCSHLIKIAGIVPAYIRFLDSTDWDTERRMHGWLLDGKGYKLLRSLKKTRIAAKTAPEKDKLEYERLTARICELDAHGGMTPLGYLIAKRKLREEHRAAIGDKPTRTDEMETFGEEIMKAGEISSEKKNERE